MKEITGGQHMNRREFAKLGFSSVVGTLAISAQAQSNEAPSPDNLARALPSSSTEPKACSDLPDLPPAPSEENTRRLFPGFRSEFIPTSGATIRVLTKGEGPALLLLHGHPETHVTWHKVASKLSEQFTVVLPDLRGYGDSSKPGYSPDHSLYSFRAMALDQVEVMQKLGHRRFMMAGHDRGGRVAHRLCLDHPDAIQKVAFLDIAPTLTMYDDTNKEFATKYLWWFLQIQPAPMPEHLISLDPVFYLRDHLFVQGKTPGAVTIEAMAEYIRTYCCQGTIRAVCEDYRAAAGIDLEMDRADDAAGRKIKVPVLALWGAEGTVGHLWDVLKTWRTKSDSEVVGKALPCGHLLPEEQPQLVLEAFQSFFGA
jgi:haloacetate dehalogenase